MERIQYNKLIRDRVKDKIEASGDACSVRTISDEAEFNQLLRKKVVEEANELAETTDREKFLAEYADLTIALDALTRSMEFSEADIKLAITESLEQKGAFKDKFFLEWAEHKD